MANEVTSTLMTEMVPALIESRVMISADKRKVCKGLVGPENWINLTGAGATTKIAQLPAVTMAARTGEGVTQGSNIAFDPIAQTLTMATYGGQFVVSWESNQYSVKSPMDMIADAVALGWTTWEESNALGFAGLYTEAPTGSPDHYIGSSTTLLDGALIRQARQLLMTQVAPPFPNGCYRLLVDPIGWGHMMQDAELRQILRASIDGGAAYAATTGVGLNRFVGIAYGVEIWLSDALISASSMIHNIMFADGSIGGGYKMISTPISPVPSECNVEAQWFTDIFGWKVNCEFINDISGLVALTASHTGGSGTGNNWIVDLGVRTT